ncbi:hypothetical protein [Streptomyces sp. A0592]|nr:hypothetical protein [Streptomyces sp. A0592]
MSDSPTFDPAPGDRQDVGVRMHPQTTDDKAEARLLLSIAIDGVRTH